MLKSLWVLVRIAMTVLLAAAGSALLALQLESRFGNTTFRLPQGWQTAEQNGSLAITPGNLPRGQEAAILVTPGQPLGGDFRAVFDKWVQLLSPREAMPGFGEIRQQRGAGYDVLTQVVTLGSGANRGVRLFMAANPGGRFEMIMAMASSEGLFRRYQTDITNFMASVGYGSAVPAAREAAPASSPNPGPAQRRLPSLSPLQPKPGWAIGRAVDARGQPLENFEVTVRRGTIQTFGLYASDTFRATNGRYEIELPKGIFQVVGYVTAPYEGQTYRIDLQPLDGQDWRISSPSDKGIVKDFVLLGSGLRAGQQPNEWGTSNIGGAPTVEDARFSLPPGTVAEVTLTPMGPLLDGSPGRVVTRSGAIVFTITDVPLGKYAVSVRIGGRPVDFELRHTSGPIVGRGPLVFIPNDAGVEGTRRVRLLVR
ncbi:MAG: hypothetical protein Q8N47_04115 [Bryobacterales bacterium]|nr:hypothetical protein [Bryobacterales bacterium]